MAADVTERPTGTVVEAPSFFDAFKTDDKEELGGDDSFPDAVVMIFVDGDKYAAINLTTPGVDPMTVGCYVCFASEQEAELWEGVWKVTGEKVNKSFQEARDISISNPKIHGLALQMMARTVSIHWVR